MDGPGSHADSQVQSMCKGPVVGKAQSVQEPERLVCGGAESESEGLGEVKGCRAGQGKIPGVWGAVCFQQG